MDGWMDGRRVTGRDRKLTDFLKLGRVRHTVRRPRVVRVTRSIVIPGSFRRGIRRSLR